MKNFSQLLTIIVLIVFFGVAKNTLASDRDEIIVIPIEPFYGGGVRWEDHTPSPYISVKSNVDRFFENTITYTVSITNFGETADPYTVTIPVPSGIELSELNDDGRWSREIEIAGGNYNYTVNPSYSSIPYIDLPKLGIKSLCDLSIKQGEEITTTTTVTTTQTPTSTVTISQTSVVSETTTPPCDSLIVPFNTASLGYRSELFETKIDSWYVATDGIIVGDTEPIQPLQSRPIPYPDDALSGFVAPLWRDNVVSSDYQDSGVYVAVLKGISPTADYSFYVAWHNVASATNPNAVARYAVAIDLTDAGSIYFIYDSVATPEEGGYGQYSIGIEHPNGVRGYGYAYAGDPLLPYGYPPKDGQTLSFIPTWLGAENHTKTIEIVATVRGQGDVPLTAYSTKQSAYREEAFNWSTWWVNKKTPYYKAFLPVIVGGGQ